MTQWSIWGGFLKKTRGQKSRATVPLRNSWNKCHLESAMTALFGNSSSYVATFAQSASLSNMGLYFSIRIVKLKALLKRERF
jgi:hypothetical protein